MTSILMQGIMDLQFTIFTYVTPDNEPGTVICRSELQHLFETDHLIAMEVKETKTIRLQDLVDHGIIVCGASDNMDSLTINYPHDQTKKPTVTGTNMHFSRKQLFGDNFDFIPPDSDTESS